MGLKKVFLLLFCILLTSPCLIVAQSASDPFSSSGDLTSGREVSARNSSADEKELTELRSRLRQIESMLMAQKDRENELLRDLNKMMITGKDQPDESEATARKDLQAAEQRFRAESANLESKIHSLELALAAGHERDLAMSQQMNKTILVTVCSVAGIGLLVFLVTVYLQYRLISRPVQPVYFQQTPLAIEAGPARLSGGERKKSPEPETGLVENSSVDDANERFLSAIERLEARIMHMEDGLSQAQPGKSRQQSIDPLWHEDSLNEVRLGNTKSDLNDRSVQDAIDEEVEAFVSEFDSDLSAETDEMDVAVLEEEGKRFLQKENWETAFQYFDQLVRLDDSRVDNWVNRGRALEMLRREEEAIESYDRAIETNPDLPSPFLYKAALLSRMERFEEAQKYYNEALAKVPVQKSEQASVSR
jgi:tetratricopeptide (TPR) repeat protein